jgi:hypothetical protein
MVYVPGAGWDGSLYDEDVCKDCGEAAAELLSEWAEDGEAAE